MAHTNAILAFQDQDSWTGGTGSVDSTTQVVFYSGCPTITCRQSRLKCHGCHACSKVDPLLLNIMRYELDPSFQDGIFAAQWKKNPPGRGRLHWAANCDVSIILFYILFIWPCSYSFFNVVGSMPQCTAWDQQWTCETFFQKARSTWKSLPFMLVR